ncbi:MAG: type 1 glutamine amidotransferase [Rhodospirillales bacterium]
MRIAVVEHHDHPSVAVVGETLAAAGADLDMIWGAQGDPMPTQGSHDALVVLGGAMNAADDETCPYFPTLVDSIRGFAAADKPVLGICLGAQLIARAFGAELQIGGPFEFGFQEIVPLPAAADDPVMNILERPLPLFQWHYDHYDLPEGAVRLATNEAYPNQSFRIGRATYGTQFHFEVDKPTVDQWVVSNPNLAENAPGFETWLPVQFENHEAGSRAFCREVTTRWAALAG